MVPSDRTEPRAAARGADLGEELGVRLEAELTGCIGCGCLSMKACALLNPGDALAGDGVGPRRL